MVILCFGVLWLNYNIPSLLNIIKNLSDLKQSFPCGSGDWERLTWAAPIWLWGVGWAVETFWSLCRCLLVSLLLPQPSPSTAVCRWWQCLYRLPPKWRKVEVLGQHSFQLIQWSSITRDTRIWRGGKNRSPPAWWGNDKVTLKKSMWPGGHCPTIFGKSIHPPYIVYALKHCSDQASVGCSEPPKVTWHKWGREPNDKASVN